MNNICRDQNSEVQLERLAAQRSLYGAAKRVFAVHAALSTVAAGALAFSALHYAELKPYAALWGIGLGVLDAVWLTPWQKGLRESAANIQESFDCDVLGLPWQSLKVGNPVDRELVVERAAFYRRNEPSFDALRDWYPVIVGRIPLFQARLVCQRCNAWWDGKQRRRYAFMLSAAVVALLLVLLAVGIKRQTQVADLLLVVLAPLSSGIILTVRQAKENLEAAGRLDKLKDYAGKLWTKALGGASDADLKAESRSLQDELFDNRKRNVPVFDWLYARVRSDQELQMKETAARLVDELEAARRGQK